jgi:hypothetical protein
MTLRSFSSKQSNPTTVWTFFHFSILVPEFSAFPVEISTGNRKVQKSKMKPSSENMACKSQFKITRDTIKTADNFDTVPVYVSLTTNGFEHSFFP